MKNEAGKDMSGSRFLKSLKDRLRQKPDSRLFLSLAEELQKRDMMDEAVAMLVGGIKKNPDYSAARLTLGRWYLAGNMLQEAKAEFLAVAGKFPDNVFARRGLEEVHARLVMTSAPDKGKSREITVSRLNNLLGAIQSRFAESPEDVAG